MTQEQGEPPGSLPSQVSIAGGLPSRGAVQHDLARHAMVAQDWVASWILTPAPPPSSQGSPNPDPHSSFQALELQCRSPGNSRDRNSRPLAGEQVRAGLSPNCSICCPRIPSPQTHTPGGWLPAGQPGLPTLAVSAKLDAITTKPLLFLTNNFPLCNLIN